MTLSPRPPRYINFFEPFHFTTGGSDRGIAHFLTATRNTIEGAGDKKKKKKKNEQTNNMLGSIQAQEGSYITLCICRLTLAWISSENSTMLLECRLILTRLPSLLWTSSHPTGLSAPVSTGHSRHPSPTLLRAPFPNSLLAFPYPLPVIRDLESKTLCLVLRQNRQRNRLLGGPPT